MAKKKEEPAVKKVKTIEDFYSIGKWNGFPQYKCNLCPFDSLDEKVIKEHIIDVHWPKQPKPVVKPKLFDRYNNEIK